MTDWILTLERMVARGEPVVLVTVAGIRGSAPRETGAKMIVTNRETIGSIGGGQLEHQCARFAVSLLETNAAAHRVRRFALGANCGQCCGGVVEVLFEALPAGRTDWVEQLVRFHRQRTPAAVITSIGDAPLKYVVTADDSDAGSPPAVVAAARDTLAQGLPACRIADWLVDPVRQGGFEVAVFGAGHVGTAVVDLLCRLECNVRWIDSRRGIFPSRLAANVTALESAAPPREVAALRPGTSYVVMTHSHPLDLEICASILCRGDAAYCGLIGSLAKRRRFERLLRKQGIAAERLESLVCPIGVPGISGKRPAEIAVAIVAELLMIRDRDIAARATPAYLEVRA